MFYLQMSIFFCPLCGTKLIQYLAKKNMNMDYSYSALKNALIMLCNKKNMNIRDCLNPTFIVLDIASQTMIVDCAQDTIFGRQCLIAATSKNVYISYVNYVNALGNCETIEIYLSLRKLLNRSNEEKYSLFHKIVLTKLMAMSHDPTYFAYVIEKTFVSDHMTKTKTLLLEAIKKKEIRALRYKAKPNNSDFARKCLLKAAKLGCKSSTKILTHFLWAIYCLHYGGHKKYQVSNTWLKKFCVCLNNRNMQAIELFNVLIKEKCDFGLALRYHEYLDNANLSWVNHKIVANYFANGKLLAQTVPEELKFAVFPDINCIICHKLYEHCLFSKCAHPICAICCFRENQFCTMCG